MPRAVPGAIGRRVGWGAIFGLVAYLWLAPTAAMFFGPLTLLLLVSRPATTRDWLWVALGAIGLAVSLQSGTALFGRTTRAGTLFFAGTLVVVTLLGLRPLFARVLASALVASAATVVWYLSSGWSYEALRTSYVTVTWATLRAGMPDLPFAPPSLDGGIVVSGSSTMAQFMASIVNMGAELLPGELALAAMLGGVLAWAWYGRVASRPLGPVAARFREFRFNDHLIWVLLGAFATALLVRHGPASLVALNLAFVFGWLYFLRGLAVSWCALQLLPPHLRLLVLLLAAMLPPVTVVISFGLPVVGVADTWLDLRRRLPPPSGVAA